MFHCVNIYCFTVSLFYCFVVFLVARVSLVSLIKIDTDDTGETRATDQGCLAAPGKVAITPLQITKVKHV